MGLDVEDGWSLIQKASSEREKDKAWQMWLTFYPNMNDDNFIPFSEFYKVETTPYVKQRKRTQEEMVQEATEIRKRFSGG